ncbi:putative hydrolase of the HAD superfamily [Krasilnikovia cinnamomea]|uniref:Putative hydrolase of the HAD superfamily n=1 Tax=Krasilnikovia cinnamomea TaxID=349313 RepID=A0A4Q7ZKQ2_9ACTN|nr:HAD family hydrolase [Krasilnikovia cinnamomea]RZU50855.1 putative hydrolase of the HAD superfamily [Krasilnikovia cinnamomea]
MLLLIDLDNTLVDRTAAFRRWATGWAPAHGGGPADVAWLIATDNDGYEPRERFARSIAAYFDLPDHRAVLAELREGMVKELELDPRVGLALAEAVAAGWSPVVVTNGTVRQQESKLRHTGLDRLVAGWVISEGAGVRKPDARMYELAAAEVGLPLRGWMIGDHAEHDVGGAVAVGLDTVWLPRGRSWPGGLPYRPTRTADDCAAAITSVVQA